MYTRTQTKLKPSSSPEFRGKKTIKRPSQLSKKMKIYASLLIKGYKASLLGAAPENKLDFYG